MKDSNSNEIPVVDATKGHRTGLSVMITGKSTDVTRLVELIEGSGVIVVSKSELKDHPAAPESEDVKAQGVLLTFPPDED